MKPTRRPPAPSSDDTPRRRLQRAPAAVPGAAPAAEGVRLSKVMVERGMCNRREADALIARGAVFVDGRQISELGTRISPDAAITLAPGTVLRTTPQPAPAVAPVAAKPAPEGVRLSKVMAERGLCSRREADALIERGWVFVDGQRVSELGTRIAPDATITLDKRGAAKQAERVTIVLHKPIGYVSGQPEDGHQAAVTLITPDRLFGGGKFARDHLKGLAPAGRLDIDSTGLLILTQDGRIARQLIGDDSEVDKEYLVRVAGTLSAEGLALLNHGLSLDGKQLRPAKVRWQNDDQLSFTLREGRKRQIRRMCELVGLKVVGLKRVRIGQVMLGDLPQGQWRYLRPNERF
ncbi:pseudouridine synthase [Denitromonas iodatirespirans]|nr:pseudouridine synthase [Denitromonas iodatirespirans]